jgi:hypothetical protein
MSNLQKIEPKAAHFSNWLSFLSGNEDAMLALVLASEWKPEPAKRSAHFQKTQMHVSGHVVQIITMPGQMAQA